jgi:hypothetical protein
MTDTAPTRGFDDIDADAHDTHGETCTCGQVHEGLGGEWFQYVAHYGVEHPAVRSMIAEALIAKGVLTLEQVTNDPPVYSADELRSIAMELAFPEAGHRYFDWTAHPEALGASAFITQVALEKMRDVAAVMLAVGLGGYAIHPAHLAQIEETLEQALKPLGTYVIQTNILQPEANTDLGDQATSGILPPETGVAEVSVEVDQPFAVKFREQVASRLDGLLAIEVKFRSLVESGTDPTEAAKIVSNEMVQALGWDAEAETVGFSI